jgi:hypothetical protein
MNKKNKNVLKSIVKECLIEILAEGLVGNHKATLSESRELRGTLQESYENSIPVRSSISDKRLNYNASVSESRRPTQRKPSYLDSIKMGVDQHRNAPEEAIKNRVSKVTNDPIMSDILADTAMTTLREQKEGGRPSGPSVMSQGDSAAKFVDQASPEDLFGDASSKWANLAFAPSIR